MIDWPKKNFEGKRCSIFGKYVSGSLAEFLGYSLYDYTDRKPPKFVRWLFRHVRMPIYNVHCYFANRFRDKIHLVELDIPKGRYRDPDHRLEMAMIAVLDFFVEKELGFALEDKEHSYKGINLIHCGDETFIDLYIWFKQNRTKITGEYDWGYKTNRKWYKAQEAFEKEYDEKLTALFKKRKAMWS